MAEVERRRLAQENARCSIEAELLRLAAIEAEVERERGYRLREIWRNLCENIWLWLGEAFLILSSTYDRWILVCVFDSVNNRYATSNKNTIVRHFSASEFPSYFLHFFHAQNCFYRRCRNLIPSDRLSDCYGLT